MLDKTTGSRDPESAIFNLLNFVVDEDYVPEDDDGANTISFKGVLAETFDDGVWVELEPFTYNDGTTIAPPDLPEQEIDYNFIGRPLRAVGLTLSAFIICLSIGFAVWTRMKRKTRVVR